MVTSWQHVLSLWEDHYMYSEVSPYHSQTSPHSLDPRHWCCLLTHRPLWSPIEKSAFKWNHPLTSLILRTMKSVSQGIPGIHPASRNRKSLILSMKKRAHLQTIKLDCWHGIMCWEPWVISFAHCRLAQLLTGRCLLHHSNLGNQEPAKIKVIIGPENSFWII